MVELYIKLFALQPQDKGSSAVAARKVIWVRNLVIELLLGLLAAVVCVISSASDRTSVKAKSSVQDPLPPTSMSYSEVTCE